MSYTNPKYTYVDQSKPWRQFSKDMASLAGNIKDKRDLEIKEEEEKRELELKQNEKENKELLEYGRTQNMAFNKGGAKFPEWLLPKSNIEVIYKAPFRIIHFLYAPFIWDVKKPSHFLGIFDSFLYIYLSYLIFSNRGKIFSDPILKIIFFILLAYIIVYGISVGNFGTGIRHRSKFVMLLILLAAPLLPKFTLSKKKNLNLKSKELS